MTHHDIDVDIPREGIQIVRTGYAAWCLACAGYLSSWFVITFMLAAGYDKSITNWILACVVTLLGVPVSWKTWYRSLYNSQISGKSRPYVQFFVHATVHLVWSMWVIVSPTLWLGATPCWRAPCCCMLIAACFPAQAHRRPRILRRIVEPHACVRTQCPCNCSGLTLMQLPTCAGSSTAGIMNMISLSYGASGIKIFLVLLNIVVVALWAGTFGCTLVTMRLANQRFRGVDVACALQQGSAPVSRSPSVQIGRVVGLGNRMDGPDTFVHV